MKNYTACLLGFLLIAAESGAKQWVILPSAGTSRNPGMASMAAIQGMAFTGGIEKLGAHKTADSDIAPLAPLGYSVEEIKPVKMFSNDPLYSQQWSLQRVMAPRGWAKAAGALSQPLVAVVDTGIDASHPDLAGRVVGGGNFVDYGGGITPGASWNDDNSHGTFCASQIAAIRDNGSGMAGIGGGARLLAVKVLDGQGYGTDYGVAQGMVWAVDNGAKIISISLGTASNSLVLLYAAQYAHDHGVLVVAAAGNSGDQSLFYPAADEGVLSVGASTINDTRAAYSTYNSMLSMVAPGGDASGDMIGAIPGGGYAHGSGTSFACPQVAGAAALYLSMHPGASADDTFASLTSTADPIDMASGKSVTTGWGRLNLARLMGEDVEPNVFGITALDEQVSATAAVVTALVGASEPKAPLLDNPDPSHVDKVWLVVLQAGTEIVRQELASMGGNDWTAEVGLPAWAGTSDRTLTLGYQAVDSTGHMTCLFNAGTVLQTAGIQAPKFTHTPIQSAEAGQALTLTVSQYPALPRMNQWTLHYRQSGAAWQSKPGTYDIAGIATFNLDGSEIKEERLEYYFSCVDGGGQTLQIHQESDSYKVAVFKRDDPIKLKYLANPSTELCVRLLAGVEEMVTVYFYSVSGEKIGEIRELMHSGENRLCLGKTVSSGSYLVLARKDDKRPSTQLKLAIKR